MQLIRGGYLKKNILIIHNYYKIPGGEDSVVKNEKRLLVSNGHHVFVYTRNNKELDNFTILKKMLLPFTMIFNLRTYYEVKKIIKEQKIDIVHVHNTLLLISPAVYYAAKKMKVPIVQTVHNFRLLCVGATFYRNGKICEKCVKENPLVAVRYGCYRNNRFQTFACVMSMLIHRHIGIYKKLNYICLTEFNKDKLLEFNQMNESNVYIKPNYVCNDNHKIIPHIKRKNQVVYAGRLDELKGIEILFNAWIKCEKDNMTLIVCGTGPMENWCKKFIEHNGITNVFLKGFVSNNDVKRIISESRALILPTQWYEGFPMSIVEAYSVGTPVIGSNMGNVGDIIVDKITGLLFDPKSEDELAEKIDQICDMALEEGVYNEYVNKYTEKENYKKLMNIYNSIYEKCR